MNASPGVDVSVVVPAFNAAATVNELAARLCHVLESSEEVFELVFVNDGSSDDTWQQLEALAANDSRVRAVDLMHNVGQPLATMAGIASASGMIVCTMDDDLQHPPEELPTLLAALRERSDWEVVVGIWSRDDSGVRNIGSHVYSLADRLAWSTPKDFRHTSFRAMRRHVAQALVEQSTMRPAVGPLLRSVSSEVWNVPVAHAHRRHGSSGITFRAGLSRTFSNFAHGSVLPLRVLTVVGATSSLGSFVAGIYLLGRWLVGARGPTGWLSAITSTLFIGGLILLGLGILGQYLALILEEVRGATRWNIRRRLNEPACDG